MKHIPILYSTDMVQAKKERKKTQTRRLRGLDFINENTDAWKYEGINPAGFHIFSTDKECDHGNDEVQLIKCPYGQPGDILWTRETYAHTGVGILYKADKNIGFTAKKWKPSLYMPKSACRMWDEIVSIRVERLQDISEEDAIAEGVKPMALDHLGNTFKTYKRGFESVITAINGPEIWDQNKWVWRIEFKPIDKPESFIL